MVSSLRYRYSSCCAFYTVLINLIVLNAETITKDLTLHKDPQFLPGRDSIVHLFEWDFRDVAFECEIFLASHGYAGVQVCGICINFVFFLFWKMDVFIATRVQNYSWNYCYNRRLFLGGDVNSACIKAVARGGVRESKPPQNL